MIRKLLFFISSFISLAVALAAIPPRSQKNLHENAVYIIIGRVKHIFHEEVKTSAGTDIHFTVGVHVKTIEKDQSTTLGDYYNPPIIKPDSEITIHYWQTGTRPEGWTGPTGLYDQPKVQEKGRFYLDLNESDQLRILEPNGWQLIS